MFGTLIGLVKELKPLLLKHHAETYIQFGHANLNMQDIMHQQRCLGFRFEDFISPYNVSVFGVYTFY